MRIKYLHLNSYGMKTNHLIITINREFGSGGRQIANELGSLLGMKVYDKTLLERIEKEFDMNEQEIKKTKNNSRSWWSDFTEYYTQFGAMSPFSSEYKAVTSREIYATEKRLLLRLAGKESCIVVGRNGFNIFKNQPNVMRILLIADFDARVKHVCEKHKVDEREAKRMIREIDKVREEYTQTYAGVSRYDARNYDFVLNVTNIPSHLVTVFLAQNVRLKFPKI